MTGDDTARLIYLVLLGSAIAMWFFAQNRASLGKLTQQALVWGLIFVGVIAAVGLWGDIRGTVQPGAARMLGENSVELRRQMDGHYYVTAEVNGTPVDFVVDTGATVVVLTREDAKAIGLDTADLAFVGRASTANGEVRTAPVRLDSLRIGPLEDRDVGAVVNSGELGQSLLGMNYLQRFSRVEIADGKLILTR
ncbi:MAG: TIGR02281 family clan AA aspartic protease [Rhodobacteraceae bacterium]|jgi:aspartyl protease family protein|nr:TIGR02281 family clan AA aspartic protease [Paracoccaceae bacterium]